MTEGKWIFKFQGKITWNVRADIPGDPICPLMLWEAVPPRGFPQMTLWPIYA